MTRLSRCVLPLLLLIASPAWSQNAPDAKPTLDREALEKKFAETMSGAVMIGSFTDSTKESKELKQEKYTLGEVKKLKDNLWLFNVRIQYGEKDATVPLPLNVEWAGDTPVITLTKQPIPGFGTFTSRVLIYDNHYAGFWWGGDHGGHLMGKITRPEDSAAKPANR